MSSGRGSSVFGSMSSARERAENNTLKTDPGHSSRPLLRSPLRLGPRQLLDVDGVERLMNVIEENLHHQKSHRSVEKDAELDQEARIQLDEWFGSAVAGWRLLRVYRMPHALPDQTSGRLDPWQRPVRLRPGLYVCGGHRDNATIDGALTSGFRAAQAVMEDLAAKST